MKKTEKTIFLIGEEHNNEEDIEYKKIISESARLKQLIYIQEGRLYNETNGGNVAHPNIVGIEDLYTYTYANLARIRLYTSKVTHGSRAYGAFLFLKQLRESAISEDKKLAVEGQIKEQEQNFDKYKVCFEKDYQNITLYLKAVSQFIFLEISQVEDHPLKMDLVSSLKKVQVKNLMEEYCDQLLISEMLDALKEKNSFHETNIQIDDKVIIKFLMDIKHWEQVIKNLMVEIAKHLSKLDEYKEFRKYLSEDLFKKPIELEHIKPILVNLRNASYLINIKLLLRTFNGNLPIYAIMGDMHLEELRQELGDNCEGFNISYYPLEIGRSIRPKNLVPQNSISERKFFDTLVVEDTLDDDLDNDFLNEDDDKKASDQMNQPIASDNASSVNSSFSSEEKEGELERAIALSESTSSTNTSRSISFVSGNSEASSSASLVAKSMSSSVFLSTTTTTTSVSGDTSTNDNTPLSRVSPEETPKVLNPS